MIADNNNSILISRDGEKKIICLRHMEEYFRTVGFIPLKNSYTNFFFKLINFKFLRKAKILFILILRSKFHFKDIKHNKIVIFDCETTKDIEKILPENSYTIVSTRIHRINKIYISKKIIFFILKNFFKRSLKQNYLTALIKEIAPKVVLTHISHSADFHIISKILHTEIEFIAIQSGTSNEFTFMPNDMKKNFFVPKLFCFSEYDKSFYKKNKINVKTLEVTGSIRSALSHEYIKLKKTKINPNKYDICLISEPHARLNGDYFQVKNMADSVGLVAEFTHKLCKKHNLNLVFSGEGEKGKDTAMCEIYFYRHYLKDYDFNIFQSRDREKEYPSYVNIMQSKLTIGFISTILREAISFEKKILSCNFTGHPDVAFPGLDSGFPKESICILTKPSFELFEKRVLSILSMSSEKYFSQLGENFSFLMLPTVETTNIIRNKIKPYLN